MTVSTQVSRNEYTGNGATTQYDFTFRILDKSHLLVQTLDTSESIVTLTLGTDYTVTGVNRYNGGKVVLTSALPAGYKISIERSTPVTQEASIRNQGGFFPEIHEDALDKLTMLVQQAYGWWSGLSLRKPSWLANYYDALNNRIRNLRDPSQPQDATTKNYVDVAVSAEAAARQTEDNNLQSQISANLQRTLRVPESIVGALPTVFARKNRLLAFNSVGNPIAVLPESGSAADVFIELGSVDLPGAIKVALKYSGSVADALSEIYVDALGEFNNLQDGCAEAITKRIKLITGMMDSAYVEGQKNFISVIYGHGKYSSKDQNLFTGVTFKGQGRGATMVYPHPDATWAFTVEGTLPFDLGGTRNWQRLMYSGLENLTIGEFWEDQGNVPEGVGGVNLEFSSYIKLSNVAFRRIRGCAINGAELFDSYFDNVSVMYCGNIITTTDPDTGVVTITTVHSVNFDKQGSDDATNACTFNRFHMEANYTGMRLHICRHMNFISPKFERDDTSHLIEGCQGIIFTSANMTWNSSSIPQFDIYGVSGTGTENSDCDGVKFISPDMRSSNKIGWYINANSTAGPTELVTPKARGISKMVKGNNYTIIGGDVYDSGPQLIEAGTNVFIDRLVCKAMKPTVAGDGTDDTIIVTGVNSAVRNCHLASQAGSATDGGAFINTTATADTIVTGNTVGGYRQYGIRAGVNQKVRDNKIDVGNNHIGSLTNQSRSNSTLVIDNTTGFGL
ncbi:phage tail fiber protein, partial [Klebsiella variicola]|uniref:phage tail fiber domain-containing protein n=1 Tax=Klebsiella variicola TaxID=244366 RepID=UPI002FE32732